MLYRVVSYLCMRLSYFFHLFVYSTYVWTKVNVNVRDQKTNSEVIIMPSKSIQHNGTGSKLLNIKCKNCTC